MMFTPLVVLLLASLYLSAGVRLSPMVRNMALSKTIEIHGLTKEVKETSP